MNWHLVHHHRALKVPRICVFRRVKHIPEYVKPDSSRKSKVLNPSISRCDPQVQLGHVLLTSVVDAKTAREGRLAVYVGHLLEFESIARDISSRPVGRQLALVGLDLIGQTRVVLSCRSKRLFFAPLEVNDVWAGHVV